MQKGQVVETIEKGNKAMKKLLGFGLYVAVSMVTIGVVNSSAEVRTIELTGNDLMQYNTNVIEVKAGEKIKIVFKNVGKLPLVAMGHNVVFLKKGTDVAAFCTAGITAKETDYIAADQSDKVIAKTKLLGPGDQDEVEFTTPTDPGDYPYVCTFPGHFALMQGVMKVK